MKKNIIIVLLAVITIGLGSYLIYDKLFNKDEPQKNESKDQIEKKDIAYFEDYLYYFMPYVSASNFLRKIDNFTEDDINTYILFYYETQVSNGKLIPLMMNLI